jgi:hypothetical protein
MGAKDSRSSQCRPNNYPHNMPTITPTIHTPHTPQELRCAIPFRLRSRELLPQFLPPLAPPVMAGLRWDRWNQRLDGTQFGDPPGGRRLGVVGIATNYFC